MTQKGSRATLCLFGRRYIPDRGAIGKGVNPKNQARIVVKGKEKAEVGGVDTTLKGLRETLWQFVGKWTPHRVHGWTNNVRSPANSFYVLCHLVPNVSIWKESQ